MSKPRLFRRSALIPVLALVAAVAVALLTLPTARPPVRESRLVSALLPKPPVPSPVAKEFNGAESLYLRKPDAAIKRYEALVSSNEKSAEPVTQDLVGSAHVRIGYLRGHQDQWDEARSSFLKAASVKGTGQRSQFGSVSDQGAYEAAVCLQAAGHPEAAAREFHQFLVARPTSPLVFAAMRRLRQLGKADGAEEKLLQTDVKLQEHEARFEAAVCGPKTIDFLFAHGFLTANQTTSYKKVAAICGTTERGTSVEQMRSGLKALGVPSFAYRLNRKALAQFRCPMILLGPQHYLAVLSVHGESARVYDPLSGGEREMQLPPADDPDFQVDAIVFSLPETQS